MHGMNIYNVLRALPARLVFHNVGNVDSIGNAIFLAGDIRLACPHSTFMFHGVGMDIPSGVRLEQKNSQAILEGIIADQTRLRSEEQKSELKSLMRQSYAVFCLKKNK